MVWTLGGLVLGVILWDLFQKKHAILRNFPFIGHFRYALEAIGPELRQYIVTGNDEERPFSRDQRRWVYASAKRQNNYFGFGTDTEQEQVENFLIVKHSAFPLDDPHHSDPDHQDDQYALPCAKILGGWRRRRGAFRPTSVVHVSGMSFGSLSSAAVEAINRGCAAADCLHNTGEGGVSPHHDHGGELIWQIGTGYFGCRAEDGGFSIERFRETVEAYPSIRAIEIKLSQGAKPGLGGVLPIAKITPEIAAIRGIRRDRDCISRASHQAFSDVSSMLDFIERLADESGRPVGIKSAIGQESFWIELAREIDTSGRAPDFITIDGGEGGTGAAPLAFSDHVALPFKVGFARVYRTFAERSLTEHIVWNGSGKLGFPETALLAFALGCDTVAVAREAMLAIGCIQAQRCHSGHCPTGVATQNRWLVRGLDPTSKADRLANYMLTLRKEVLRLSRACGVPHPSGVTLDHLDILDGQFGARPAREVFGYEEGWGRPDASALEAVGG
ncbi:MAG: FMN-binding glutamate synthase family protein [Acidobacteriota bacterium]